MSCEIYRDLLPAYLDDSLDEVRRAGFRTHLRSCDRCREFALAEDPTLVFAFARRVEPEPAEIESCVEAVMSGIRRDRLERRLRPSRRPWFAAAAAVLVAAIAAGAWWIQADSAGGSIPLQADAHAIEAPEMSAVVDEAPAQVEPPPRIEVEMTQDEVRVYAYAIEDDASTGAVFIVNPGMEL